jgi:protein-S-isoprenylcysteine O-methyltransferase Ste14
MLENARELIHLLEDPREVVTACWLMVAAAWLLTLYRLKPIGNASRSGTWEMLMLTCAAVLLFTENPQLALLQARYLPEQAPLVGLGLVLTAAGATFAIVARLYLGRNWSAVAILRQNHELISTGPYRLVRHPIYTGMLTAAVGTAIVFGETRDLLALPLIIVGFWRKARSEERLLMSNFGDRYAAYRQKVRGAIVPYVL